ncbi:unnamed protein product [Ilex paraguariensis]|uniref:Embryonic stem cell-specific 5-hydroxymethylcytosine-binding protein n=1 Tax=Ilex paraguariensis TaxID=185542 RepID=A0ABC8R788_9AQUA
MAEKSIRSEGDRRRELNPSPSQVGAQLKIQRPSGSSSFRQTDDAEPTARTSYFIPAIVRLTSIERRSEEKTRSEKRETTEQKPERVVMCGRCRYTLRADDISRACHLNGPPVRSVDMDRYRPSYNVSPGSNLPVVRRDDGSDGQGAVLHCMKWGLIPSFTKKTDKPDHYKMFNARTESICEKPSFRRLVPKNRCLVAIEGFYEWKKDGSKKQPYYIHFKDGRPLVLAALYDSWKNLEGETYYTFTILTTSSSSALNWLHDRMPVILGDKGSTDMWLTSAASTKFDAILKPYEQPDLVWYPVTPAMGKPSFDGPECIKEIQLKAEETNTISKFFSKKGIKSEQQSYVKNTHDAHIKTSQLKSLKEEPETPGCTDKPKRLEEPETQDSTGKPKRLKEEPETEEGIYHQSFQSLPVEDKDDSKPNVSALWREGTTDFQSKRGYEEFLADTKLSTNETAKLSASPMRKKEKAGDKQPTLFSYFGKN